MARHKKKLLILLICAGIAVAGFNIGTYYYGQWVMDQQEKLTREIAQTEISPTPEPTTTMSESPAEATLEPFATIEPVRYIDFEALNEQNEEIVAWIEIPNTKVDYPVVQGEDNVFYLDHDALLDENEEGAIFVDAENTPGFIDRNTILYGHRMNNGNMFAELHDFRDVDFFDNNRAVYLYMSDGSRLDYEIFAAYETGDEYILDTWDFNDDTVWAEYIDQIGEKDEEANIRDVGIDAGDKIITLSTCVRYEDEKRYLLQAVLRPEGEVSEPAEEMEPVSAERNNDE